MADQHDSRLWVSIVDQRAQSTPNALVGLIPKGSEVTDGYQELTFQVLSHAVNACARWIEAHIGLAKEPETVAYMAANDVRYLIVILALHKTGYKPLLLSHRLSDEAYKHILTVTHCQNFFYTPDKQRRVAEIQSATNNLNVFEIQSLEQLLDSDGTPYPFNKTFQEVEDEVAICIHSSGTTGMPKPAPLTHGFLSTMDAAAYIPRPQERRSSVFYDLKPGQPVVSTTPLFHLMGLMSFTESLFHGIPFVLCPDKPMSANLIIEVIQATHPTAALLGPSMLADMVDSPSARKSLQTLDAVYFGGAPLDPEVGDILQQDVKVISLFGSSEMGLLMSFVPEGEKVWGYFEWSPEYGVKMEDQGEDGLYELVIPRRHNSRQIHGIFHTFPNLNEYHTNDLFQRHPERPELWKYRGRKDDVIVLSNGEKLNPVSMEEAVKEHPDIKHALMIGQNHFETALLIEPTKPVEDEKAFVQKVWQTVEQANEKVPKYGRVSKNKVRLASPSKPFKITPKGVMHRRTIISDYEKEIGGIYAEGDDVPSAPLPEALDLESLRDYARDLLSGMLERPDLTDNEDLYGAGLDSLQTIQLARVLHTAVASRLPNITTTISQQQIYANPSVSQLAQYLFDAVHGRAQISSASRSERINKVVEKYTSQLPPRCPILTSPPAKSTVILTGSTGSLGAYLLHRLLTDPEVAKVYCFNRSDDAQPRQRSSFVQKGLDPTLLDDPSRVEFLTVALGEKQFGLSNATYSRLLDSVSLIIHNSWKVNFNQSLESFEDPHLRGVLELLWFSHRSASRAHLTFVSSVSTIGEWDSATMGPVVPEAPLESCDAVMEQGYGESKHVGERLCWAAARDTNIPTTVLRVGQIAGPTSQKGMWGVNEWLPSLVKTSVSMNKVPADLGAYRVDWVPVDVLAAIVVDLTRTRQQEQQTTPHGVYHLVNPHQVKWNSLVPAIQKKYANIQTVSLEDWLQDLGAVKAPTEAEVQAKPALKLLDFYRGLTGSVLSAEVSVERTQNASATMAKLGPVTADLLENWLDQWDF